jgi:uncharacterized protein
MIISHFQAKRLQKAKKEGLKSVNISLDLGITEDIVKINDKGYFFSDGQVLEEVHLKKVDKDDTSCFLIRDNSILKMKLFSEKTDRLYKLVPTKDAPTIEISGIRMHATKQMTPMQDTRKKLESIGPVFGNVLDTCMGLGYTAIEASKTADIVFTCEKDENVLEMAKHNPYSKDLFNNKKISIIKTNSFEEIKVFKSAMFDFVIHDPPRLSLASYLYSAEFYKQVIRVLKKGGKLYHYTGNPGSKKRNVKLPANVMKKLKHVGFKDVKLVHYGVFGVKRI